jgi:hypothetical protein
LAGVAGTLAGRIKHPRDPVIKKEKARTKKEAPAAEKIPP